MYIKMRSNRSRKKNTRRNKNRRTYRRKSPKKRINRKRYSNKKRTGRRRINSKRRRALRGGAGDVSAPAPGSAAPVAAAAIATPAPAAACRCPPPQLLQPLRAAASHERRTPPPECTFRGFGVGGNDWCMNCGEPEYHPNHIHEFEGNWQGGYVFDEFYCKHCNNFKENIIHIPKHNYEGLPTHVSPCRVCGEVKGSIVHN